MTLTTDEETILNKQIEIDVLQAKLDKKREVNRNNETLDEEVLYSKRKALGVLLEVQV
jgi:hypothetical protein